MQRVWVESGECSEFLIIVEARVVYHLTEAALKVVGKFAFESFVVALALEFLGVFTSFVASALLLRLLPEPSAFGSFCRMSIGDLLPLGNCGLIISQSAEAQDENKQDFRKGHFRLWLFFTTDKKR
jgi:hypothetical protein